MQVPGPVLASASSAKSLTRMTVLRIRVSIDAMSSSSVANIGRDLRDNSDRGRSFLALTDSSSAEALGGVGVLGVCVAEYAVTCSSVTCSSSGEFWDSRSSSGDFWNNRSLGDAEDGQGSNDSSAEAGHDAGGSMKSRRETRKD